MTVCNVCGFKDFHETPKKFKCNLCGKIIKKHQEPMKRKRPLNPDRLQEELGE